MAAINPYLTLDGNCEEAFNFYKSVFGGEFLYLGRFNEVPSDTKLAPGEENLIMHVSLPLGNGFVLMGSDRPASMGAGVTGNNMSLSVSAASEAEADKIFAGLSAGGQIGMPLQKTFWGAYFGMLTDKFGFQWMVNYDYPREA